MNASHVPHDAERDTYLVLNTSGATRLRLGEIDAESVDRAMLIRDLLDGQ